MSSGSRCKMQIMTRIIPEFLEIWTCSKLIVVLGRSPRPPPTIPLGGHFDFGSFTQINPLAVLARWSFGWFKWSRNEPQIFHIFITCIFIWISQRLLLEPSYSITPSFLTVTGCLADFANKKIKFFDNQKNHFGKNEKSFSEKNVFCLKNCVSDHSDNFSVKRSREC